MYHPSADHWLRKKPSNCRYRSRPPLLVSSNPAPVYLAGRQSGMIWVYHGYLASSLVLGVYGSSPAAGPTCKQASNMGIGSL